MGSLNRCNVESTSAFDQSVEGHCGSTEAIDGALAASSKQAINRSTAMDAVLGRSIRAA